jgi:4-hydroxybenzoate polyprenyltransferase
MINQYSFIIIALALIIVAGFILLKKNPKWNDYLAFGVVVAGFITAWVILHPVQTPLMENAKNVKAMIGAGKPVLLEFQSPY